VDLPFLPFDQAVAALIEDLRERGLDRRVLLVGGGDFGRTPPISYAAADRRDRYISGKGESGGRWDFGRPAAAASRRSRTHQPANQRSGLRRFAPSGSTTKQT
jgi:hypothetical protein